MKQFVKRNANVKAVQWFPAGTEGHEPIPCVVFEKPQIHFSLDRRYYYVDNWIGRGPSGWLSTFDVAAELVEKCKRGEHKPGFFDPMIALLKRTDISAEYGREWLPFAVWKVKSGESRPITDSDIELVKDYGSVAGWTAMPGEGARVREPNGSMPFLQPGDWVVMEPNGENRVVRQADFDRLYEPA